MARAQSRVEFNVTELMGMFFKFWPKRMFDVAFMVPSVGISHRPRQLLQELGHLHGNEFNGNVFKFWPKWFPMLRGYLASSSSASSGVGHLHGTEL